MLERFLKSLLTQVGVEQNVIYYSPLILCIGATRHYKVCSLNPNSNGAASVDPNLSWECIMRVRVLVILLGCVLCTVYSALCNVCAPSG